MFGALKIGAFLYKNMHIIAAIIAIGVVTTYVYQKGIQHERGKWEAAQAEQTASLNSALEETRLAAAEAARVIQSYQRERATLLEELENEANNQVGSTDVCISGDGVHSLKSALEALRPTTPGAIN